MEKKIITESEMKELLESNENLDNHCVDLETARKIIMDAILPLCKWTIKLQEDKMDNYCRCQQVYKSPK